MPDFLKKSFTVYAGKITVGPDCFSKAETCKNNGVKCGDCVRVQGRFTNYMTSADQLKEWQTSNIKLAKERNAGTERN